MTSNILNIAKDITLQKIKTTTIPDLHDKCIVPTILYGCETWTINKKQMEAIENMQLYSLRRILKTPQTTPKVAIYGETGTIKLEEKINSRQVIYIQKVLSQESYRFTCAEYMN